MALSGMGPDNWPDAQHGAGGSHPAGEVRPEVSGGGAEAAIHEKWRRPAGFWLGQLGELPDPYRNVEVVLVEPKYPGNIGSVARAMANMGFTQLCLVRPRATIERTALIMAKEGASILHACRMEESLDRALVGASLMIGMTRRGGRDRINAVTAEEVARLARGIALGQKIALLFGSEDQGLDNETLGRCHWLVKIPGGSYYDSLNLSHAVTVLCYELHKAFSELDVAGATDALQEEALMDHLRRVLLRVGFLDEEDRVRMMLRLREILGRAGLVERDRRILHGLLHQIESHLR